MFTALNRLLVPAEQRSDRAATQTRKHVILRGALWSRKHIRRQRDPQHVIVGPWHPQELKSKFPLTPQSQSSPGIVDRVTLASIKQSDLMAGHVSLRG